jgi:hypothetical protein
MARPVRFSICDKSAEKCSAVDALPPLPIVKTIEFGSVEDSNIDSTNLSMESVLFKLLAIVF